MRGCFLFLFAMLPFGYALAQADVTLEITFPEGRAVLPGQVIEAEVVMINLGPGIADGVSVGTGWPATTGFRTFSVFPTGRTSPCSLSFMEFVDPLGGTSSESVTISPSATGGGVLAPGGRITCVVGVSVAPEAPRLNVAFFSIGTFAADPDTSNDTVSVEIINGALPAIAVPGPQLGSLLVLVCLICSASLFHFRAWSRASMERSD